MDPPLLELLPELERRRLLASARRRRFGRNQTIFHEGDSGDTLHLVERGHVALSIHTPLGDVATARIVRRGDFFGELAVVLPGPRNATAVALDRVETIAITRGQLNDLRAEHDAVNELLLTTLVSEIRRLADQLVEVMYIPVDKRVWRRLDALATLFGSDSEPAVSIPLTQSVIAQLTGCTRSTVNRVLRRGEHDGVVRMVRGAIEIVDAAELRRRAR